MRDYRMQPASMKEFFILPYGLSQIGKYCRKFYHFPETQKVSQMHCCFSSEHKSCLHNH